MQPKTKPTSELVSRHTILSALTPPVIRWLRGAGPAGSHLSLANSLKVVLIAALIGVSYWITYATGGTGYVYVHVGYVPVLVAAALFGYPAGLASGLLVGLALGPAMPLDTELGLAQSTSNWLIRIGFFMTAGAIAGATVSVLSANYRRLNQMACFDPVSGLPNGSVFYSALHDEVQCRQPDLPMSCLFIEHPTYEEVLLTLGSREADELVEKLARNLAMAVPAGSSLHHMRSGRFATFLHGAAAEDAAGVARNLMAAGGEAIEVRGVPIAVDSHCGVARLSPDTTDAWSLARQTLAALEHAMQRGMDVATYEQVKQDRQPDALMILGEFRNALTDGGGLYLVFQPQIDIGTGRCVGVEALIRWDHAVLGAIAPVRFIPVVEKTAMIRMLTRWVIETAVRQSADWKRSGLELPIAVNISARDLSTPGFPEFVQRTLERHQVAPGSLELEITETAAMFDPIDNPVALAQLAEIGLMIAIDDFGTGYSSLERLKQLPADALKIDQTFIRHLDSDPNDASIVRASIALAHGMGMRVIAEGVETQTASDLLKTFGCDIAQGYLFARPLPEPALRDWLASNLECNADYSDGLLTTRSAAAGSS